MSFAGMRQHFLQIPIIVARSIFVSIGRLFQNLSDARTRLPQTPVRAFVGRPYPYSCIRALGGNFIMTHTVYMLYIWYGREVHSRYIQPEATYLPRREALR